MHRQERGSRFVASLSQIFWYSHKGWLCLCVVFSDEYVRDGVFAHGGDVSPRRVLLQVTIFRNWVGCPTDHESCVLQSHGLAASSREVFGARVGVSALANCGNMANGNTQRLYSNFAPIEPLNFLMIFSRVPPRFHEGLPSTLHANFLD
jgi:hypothetical protein